MSEIVTVLLVLGVLLILVMVIGHGLWVIAEAIFRAVFRLPRSRPPRPVDAETNLQIEAQQIAAQQILLLVQRSAITQEQGRQVLQALRQEYIRKTGLAPTTYPLAEFLLPLVGQPLGKPAPAGQPTPQSPAAANEEIIFAEVAQPRQPPSARPQGGEVKFLPPTSPKQQSPPAQTPSPAEKRPPAWVSEPDEPQPASSGRRAPNGVEPTPRRTLADMLSTFMEESNIRWVEVISGMLIVVCFLGLVISLRTRFQEVIPFFTALTILLGTGVVHFVGLYTWHRWKLKSTSRALLIIATLLAPLSFMSSIVFSSVDAGGPGGVDAGGPGGQESGQWPGAYWLAVLVGVAGFGAMNFLASKTLLGKGFWRLFVPVMGASVGQLIIHRTAGAALTTLGALAVAALPLISFLVAVVAQMELVRRHEKLTRQRAETSFLVLGVALFSLVMTWGLFFHQPPVFGDTQDASQVESMRLLAAHLSPAIALALGAVLGLGLTLHQRTVSSQLTNYRIAGTAAWVLAAMLMAVAVLAAWPVPDLLIAVGVTAAAAMFVLAVRAAAPWLHAGGLACVTVSALAGVHLMWGETVSTMAGRQLVITAASGVGGVTLLGLACAAIVSCWLLQRSGRDQDAHVLLISGGVLGGLGMLVSAGVGVVHLMDWGSPMGADFASPVMMLGAAGSVLAAGRRKRPELAWAGAAVLWFSLCHALAANSTIIAGLAWLNVRPAEPILLASLIHSAACMSIAMLVARRPESSVSSSLATPLSIAALISSIAAAPFVLHAGGQEYLSHAVYAAVVALVWLGGAALHRRPELFTAFQGASFIAAGLAFLAAGKHFGWWNGAAVDPHFIPFQMIAITAWCGLWSGLRWLGLLSSAAPSWARPSWPAVDQFLLGALVAVAAGWSVFGVLPGVAVEMGWVESAPELWGGENYMLAYQVQSWLALAAVTAALLLSLLERRTVAAMAGVIIVGAALAGLAAANVELATASALRWAMAIHALAFAVLICLRQPQGRVARLLGFNRGRIAAEDLEGLRWLALLIAVAPVLGLTIYAVFRTAAGSPPPRLAAETIFRQMGTRLAHGAPWMMVIGVLFAYALRERKSFYALLGSVIFQGAATLACVMTMHLAGDLQTAGRTPPSVFIQLLQWNAIALGIYAAVWLACRRWMTSQPEKLLSELFVQIGAIWLTLTAICGAAAVRVAFFTPQSPDPYAQLGNWLSFAGWGLGLFITIAWLGKKLPIAANYLVLPFGGGLVALAAASLLETAPPGDWLAYHVLTGGWLAFASVAVAIAAYRARHHEGRVAPALSTAIGFGLVLIFLAFYWINDDPWKPWPVAMIASNALLAGFWAVYVGRQWAAYVSTLLAMMAVSVFWYLEWLGSDIHAITAFLQLNLLATAVTGGVWLAAELHRQRVHRQFVDPEFPGPPAHRFMLESVLGLFFLFSLAGLFFASLQRSADRAAVWIVDVSNLGGLSVLLGAGALAFASLWDRRQKLALPAIYLWGLAVLTLALDQCQWPARQLLFAGGFAIAGYVALTGQLWRQGARLAKWGARLGIEDPVAGLSTAAKWLPPVTLLLTAGVIVIEFAVVLTFQERTMRYAAGFAPLLLAWGVAGLAQKERRQWFRYLAMLLAGVTVVFIGWADMMPTFSAEITLTRMVRLLASLSIAAFLYVAAAQRLQFLSPGWRQATFRAGVTSGALAIGSLLVVLAMEAALFEREQGAPIGFGLMMVVSVALIGLIVGLLAMALQRKGSPLFLSENHRMMCVYTAEVVGVLLWAHIFLTHPELFSGRIRRYWPYIVMTLAFVGVGLGELFQRRGLRVLAEPLQRTGAFLPLVPALGIWIVAAERTQYSILLFIIGMLYALLAVFWQSYKSGLAAALAGNLGLLWLLGETGQHPLEHPQFWMIPPALSVLIAAQLNRERISQTQLTALRYASLTAIYLSSTSEIIIAGAAESLWPPIILALVALMGVAMGIVLRVRAFLYLGTGFVFVSLVSMVWHAWRRLDHVWVWWAFGMGVGAAILAVFILFELKRNEILHLIERLRHWEK